MRLDRCSLAHIMSDWSEPFMEKNTNSMMQERHCVQCNLAEFRQVTYIPSQ